MTKDYIVNETALEWQLTSDDAGHFESYRKPLAQHAHAEKLGASLYKLMPGKTALPLHCHHGNEEAIYILEGVATLRINEAQQTVKKGDYIALRAGRDSAHQLLNSSKQPLIYLCLSTMNEPDVIECPDSDKIGIICGSAPGGDRKQRTVSDFYHTTKDSRRYWEGE